MCSMISFEVPFFRFACFLASRGVALHPRERERGMVAKICTT